LRGRARPGQRSVCGRIRRAHPASSPSAIANPRRAKRQHSDRWRSARASSGSVAQRIVARQPSAMSIENSSLIPELARLDLVTRPSVVGATMGSRRLRSRPCRFLGTHGVGVSESASTLPLWMMIR
jgi:hypothetical protein